jgi:ABC-2 type transport system ATP-binding protein
MMIVSHGLTKRFGRITAVDAVDLGVPRGRVVGFLGPNGAGKSTTIRMLAGILPPTAGWAEVDGFDVERHPSEVRRRIGYLPEAAPLYTEMRVIEFLRFRAKIFGVERGKRRRNIDMVLRRCALEDVRRRPIHQLSKGYRQRVGLAAAMLHQPPVLILDEPTVGLDPTQIREVRGLLRELAQTQTILLSTHILPEVELTCDQIIMIARGRIRAQGTIDELRSQAERVARYIVETDSAKATQPLSDMKGVKDVQSRPIDERWRRVTVTAAEGERDLRERIAGILSGIGCNVRELRREAPTLEHLFVTMIARAEQDAASETDGGSGGGSGGRAAAAQRGKAGPAAQTRSAAA